MMCCRFRSTRQAGGAGRAGLERLVQDLPPVIVEKQYGPAIVEPAWWGHHENATVEDVSAVVTYVCARCSPFPTEQFLSVNLSVSTWSWIIPVPTSAGSRPRERGLASSVSTRHDSPLRNEQWMTTVMGGAAHRTPSPCDWWPANLRQAVERAGAPGNALTR